MTLRQKQKVAVLFTKISTLTPNNVQPPAAGTSPWTERPPKRRILLGAQDVRYIPCEFGVDRPTRFRDMDYAIFTHWPQCKIQPPPRPRGRSSPNYLVPVPGVCSTLSQNFTPIAPSCVEISSTVQKNSKLNITPNATLYGEIIIVNNKCSIVNNVWYSTDKFIQINLTFIMYMYIRVVMTSRDITVP